MIIPTLTDTQKALIREARDLIKDPTKWIQGNSAKTSQLGHIVDPKDPLANCFCAAGALERVRPDEVGMMQDLYEPLSAVAFQLYDDGLVAVNDHHGHAAVLRVFAVTLGEEDA